MLTAHVLRAFVSDELTRVTAKYLLQFMGIETRASEKEGTGLKNPKVEDVLRTFVSDDLSITVSKYSFNAKNMGKKRRTTSFGGAKGPIIPIRYEGTNMLLLTTNLRSSFVIVDPDNLDVVRDVEINNKYVPRFVYTSMGRRRIVALSKTRVNILGFNETHKASLIKNLIKEKNFAEDCVEIYSSPNLNMLFVGSRTLEIWDLDRMVLNTTFRIDAGWKIGRMIGILTKGAQFLLVLLHSVHVSRLEAWNFTHVPVTFVELLRGPKISDVVAVKELNTSRIAIINRDRENGCIVEISDTDNMSPIRTINVGREFKNGVVVNNTIPSVSFSIGRFVVPLSSDDGKVNGFAVISTRDIETVYVETNGIITGLNALDGRVIVVVNNLVVGVWE